METLFKKDEDRAAMRWALVFAVLAIALYFGMNFINEIKTYDTIGMNPQDVHTIDVTGSGDAFAVPNVATIAFSIEQKSGTVADAQRVVNTKMDSVSAFLKSAGIADADVQTVNYSANPEYSYPTPCLPSVPCPASSSQPKFLDYDVDQSLLVKVRDTTMVGKVLGGIGSLGVTDISGPDFTVDNTDAVEAQARKNAIDDAQSKAQVLAADLGVHLVRVVNFSDNTNNQPAPMYAMDAASGVAAQPPVAQVPAGQSKYVSNVTITYEIQ